MTWSHCRILKDRLQEEHGELRVEFDLFAGKRADRKKAKE